VPDESVTPFRVDVPQADVDDLRARLRNTRWASEQNLAGNRGIAQRRVRELAQHWRPVGTGGSRKPRSTPGRR